MIKNVLKGGTYMIIRKSQIRVDESNLKNGRGLVKREFIVEGENLRNKAKLFSKITIPKGNSIGMHDHVDDFEIYYILSGKGKVLDTGQEVEVSEGDAIYTADGNKHCIENIGEEDLVFIATVINE